MQNETNILSSILDIPVKPEPSFQLSRVEQNTGERFDDVFRGRVDFHRNDTHPAPPQKFEAKERPTPEQPGHTAQIKKEESTPSSERQPADFLPATPEGERRGPAPLHDDATHLRDDETTPKVRVNPFTPPLDRLSPNLNPIDTVDDLLNTRLTSEGASVIDTLKELLAGLNIDAETIDQLVNALNNGNAAGVQNILAAFRGLLQVSNSVTQAPGAEIVAEAAANRLNTQEQQALNLLVRAGLTREDARQVIQQIRTGNLQPSATENTTQAAKTVIETLAPKLNSENSGNLQNSDNGSTKNTSEGPRNFTGLATERVETLASLIAPDKAGNAQTNPLIIKSAAGPLTNLNASGQPAPGILAEGAQAPAAVADAAAKGVDFVKPAVTETYNGRASMDKPITAQIIEKFTLRGFGNQREVHIKLDPPSLGTVRMNVSTSGESVRATIVAENHVVKAVIENNLTQLKDSITQQGIKIDSFNVLVGGNASHSAEGHQSALDYLGQLGRENSIDQEPAEEMMTLHRPIFLNENQSFSIFA